MNFSKSQRSSLMGVAAVLVALVVFLQIQIDPLRRQPAIEPPNAIKAGMPGKGGAAALPFEYTLGALTGFRQVIAGILWVRSDAFFHEGNYDAILPLIRMITWLDPNWLDPYATGAWHLTYNFTDTDQRSDRRYLPAGVALLDEGIANNPNIYDMYKEAGWLNFDKIKDYDQAVKYYERGTEADPHFDVTQVGHALAHSYERAGRLDDAEKMWKKCIALHEAVMNDPKAKPEDKGRNDQGLKSSRTNLAILQIRRAVRPKDTQPPYETNFTAHIVRVRPKVLEISGTVNIVGCEDGAFDVNKGILVQGPRDGARVETRLQDAGYVMPKASEFTYEVDDKLTIMQDALSTRDGKKTEVGGLYIQQSKTAPAPDRNAQKVAVYGFDEKQGAGLGVPLDKALAGAAPISPFGQLQIVMNAYPLPYQSKQIMYSPAEVAANLAKLKADPAKIADMTKKGYCVATKAVTLPCTYKREIDMSKDPKMYSFTKGEYELILSINPRNAPDFIKDRIGWNGEGWTDAKYLDTKTVPNVRIIRRVIKLTKEDLTGAGEKVLIAE